MFENGSDPDGRRLVRTAAVARLRAVMDELAGLPVDPAATRANLDEAALLERARSWASAQQARVLAGLEVAEPRDYDPGTPHLPSPRATTPHEVALLLRVSTASARGRLEVARGLVQHFPETLAAATDGTLPWWQARRAWEDTVELSPAGRAAVDRELATHAGKGRSPARFPTRLRAAILDADPATAEQAHVQSLADRAVWVDPRPDGTVVVAATLAAEGGGVFLQMADHLADSPLSLPPAGWPVEGRTADQRRSDGLNGLAHALVAGFDAAGTSDPAAAAQQAVAAVLERAAVPAGEVVGTGAPRAGRRLRRGGQVLVTVSAETLLGISDAPGTLDGYGPISAGHARRLAQSVDSWRRLLTDPTSGAVLDIGRTRYAPTTAIAEHVLARSARQCTRPGCPRPAAHLDHAHPWADHGATAASNLTGLCVGDHRARHTGWTVAVTPDGTTTITTRHGFTATTPPHDHRPADRQPPRPRTGEPNRAAPPAPPAPNPATPLARLRALFPAADHTDFPTPAPKGVGDPRTGHGWLTEIQHYVHTTHDRARAEQAKAPRPEPPPEPALGERAGPDDPPPF